jgi:hypothetical protein
MFSIFKIMWFGFKRNKFLTLILLGLPIFVIAIGGQFIYPSWLIVILTILVGLAEIGNVKLGQTHQEVLNSHANKNPKEGELAWQSWNISHFLTIMIIVAAFGVIRSVGLDVAPYFSLAFAFIYWLRNIIREYYTVFFKTSQNNFIDQLREKLKEKLKKDD